MKFARSLLALTLFLLLPTSFAHGGEPAPLVQDGDIIFHTSRSSQSIAVQRATGSRYSHMGIILFRNGSPMVYEAVRTVRSTPLQKWIARGEGGHYVVKRLVNAEQTLNAEALARLRRTAGTFEGKPYDLTFEWSDDRIYCSELVWKIYERALDIHIGALQRLRDFRLDDPAVRSKMKERYGNAVPLNEPVISPASMFNASNLTVVLQQ